MIFMKAYTSRANAMLFADLINIFSRKLIYRANAMLITNFIAIFYESLCNALQTERLQTSKIFQGLLPKWKVEESYLNAYLKTSLKKGKLIEIVSKGYLNASRIYLKASLERDRFPVEKVQTRIMSPPSVRLGQPGKHQIVSKSGNLEIFFWILRQFGDVLKMPEIF